MDRKKLLLLLTGVFIVSLLFTPAKAQSYRPNRPVELVVHSALGGGSDVFAREVVAMAEREKLLTQPIRIVNKTASAGLEAIAYLADKKATIIRSRYLPTPGSRLRSPTKRLDTPSRI